MAIPYAPLIKSLSGKIFKPTTLAVVASVGIHALVLGVSLPSQPMFSEEEKLPTQQRTVSLIELTPVERTRLPDLSPPSPSLDTSFPDISTLDSSSFQSNNNQANLPQISALPPFPPLPNGSPPALPSLPQTWEPIRIAPLPAISLPPPPSPNPNLQSRQPQNIQSPVNPDSLRARQRLFDSNRTGNQTTPEDVRDLINQKQPAQIPGQSLEPTQPRTTNERDIRVVRIEDMSPQELADLRLQRLREEGQQRQEKLRQNSTNTTQEEARRNYVGWLPETEELSPTKLAISGTYPQDACLRKLEGTAIYGIRINGNGQMVDSRLIQSSGYPLFNDLALQTIQGRSFENGTGKLKPYMVSVDFKYNPKTCPSSNVQPNSEATQSNPNPQPRVIQNQEQQSPAGKTPDSPPSNNSQTPPLEVQRNPVPQKPANNAAEVQPNPDSPKPNNSTAEVPQNPVPQKPANNAAEVQPNASSPKPNSSTAEVPQNPVPTNPNKPSVESQNSGNTNELSDSTVESEKKEP